MRAAAKRILAALENGEQISIQDSRRLQCGAVPQRISELRAHGVAIADKFGVVNGKRQAWKVYFIPGAKRTAPAPHKGTVIVREHTRKVNVFEHDTPDLQGSLFQ